MARDYFAEEIAGASATKDYFSEEISKGKKTTKQNPVIGVGKGMLDIVRGATKPLVETSAHTLQGLQGLAQQATGRPVNMPTYNVPFYGEIPPIQNAGQAVGNALQTSASVMPAINPALAGAMFSGGGALNRGESPVSTAISTGLGAGLGAVSSAVTGLNKGKLIQEATNIYRKVLRPSASEIKKVTIGKGENIDKYFALAAKEKLPIKMTPDKKLDTTEAIGILQTKQSAIHDKLSTELAKDTTKRFNLNNIRQKAKLEAGKAIKNASELKVARQNIDQFIDDEITRTGGKFVNASELNNIKQGMWSVSYNPLDPAQNIKADSARYIGHISKKIIENYSPSSSIASLNRISGDYATLQRLLENAQGRSSGTLVKEGLGRILGGMAGAATPHPIMGSAIGQSVGGKIVNFMNNPDIATKFAQWKMSRGVR